MNIDIVLGGDRRILPGMAVTVRSALEHATQRINVHALQTPMRYSPISICFSPTS
jgi:lipopolysaccharide biosynthesis glycosyltransferase